MKRFLIGVTLLIAFHILAVPAMGQSLSVEKLDYVVGEELTVAYLASDDENAARPLIGIYRVTDNARLAYAWAGDPERGSVTLRAPADPGFYEVRLVAGESVLARARIKTVVTPIPEGLALAQSRYRVGEPLQATVSLPQGRYYYYPWVGMYQVGYVAEGGAVVGDRQIARLDARDEEPVTFRAPAEPGLYELRLYDRNRDFYILDTVRFEVYADPVGDSLALDGDTFVAGQPMTLSVDLPEGRYLYYPWVGLYSAAGQADGGAGVDVQQLDRKGVSEDGQLHFQAPHLPGRYEFRLYDRNSDRFVLDSISFDVEVPPVPDALSIDKSTYVVGEAISLQAQLPSGRYYYYPWVGLYSTAGQADGGAGVDVQQLDRKGVSEDGQLHFQAPHLPGTYEFRVYDRNQNRFLLDTITFEVEVPPVPGALSVEKAAYTVGEKINVTANLPTGRYYHYPWVGMFSVSGSSEAGAGIDRSHIAQRNVGSGENVTFTAPSAPGSYEFRLYDRNENRYLLDTFTFRVSAPPASTLAVERQTYRPGELVRVRVRMPEGRYAHYPWVGLYRSGYVASGGALVAENQLRSFSIDHETRRLAFQAPQEPGPYELRLYDRNSNHFILNVVPFEVRDPTRTYPVAGGHRFTPLPEDASANEPTSPTRYVDPGPLGEPPDQPSEPEPTQPTQPSAPAGSRENNPPDLWSAELEAVRDRYARQNGKLLNDAREANRSARELNQFDRLMQDPETEYPLTQEEIRERLNGVQRRIAAAPESELADLLAERAVLERLLRNAEDHPITQDEMTRLRGGLHENWKEKYDAFKASERARNETMRVLTQRDGFLRQSSDDELSARLAEVQAGLDRPDDFGLTEHELTVLRREKSDIESELSQRSQAKANQVQTEQRASRTLQREISPALSTLRQDLKRAADEEDVTVGRTLAGNEPLFDRSGNLNPAALAEDSLFAQVSGLPQGESRTRASLEYLETWKAFNQSVAPTLEDNILGDDYFEALMYNSGTRADMRVKAASLLAEEAPDMIAMMNRTDAPRELQDLNGQRLSRIMAQLYTEGGEITGQDRATSTRRINEYLSQAITRASAGVVEANQTVKALERGEEPPPQLVEEARRNGVGPLSQARLNARLRASDLGYFLGSIEAGHIRAGFDEVKRLQAEEASVKAFIDFLFAAGSAPIPGPGKLVPVGGNVLDTLKSTLLNRVKGKLTESGVPATEARLRQQFRQDVTRFRDIAAHLIPITDDREHELYDTWQNTRDRVVNDPLNSPNQR